VIRIAWYRSFEGLDTFIDMRLPSPQQTIQYRHCSRQSQVILAPPEAEPAPYAGCFWISRKQTCEIEMSAEALFLEAEGTRNPLG
jgi:hypothetical protein